VALRTGSAAPRNIVPFFVDAYVSAGVDVHARDQPAGAGRSFGPFGVRHVNQAGQECREFLQGQRPTASRSSATSSTSAKRGRLRVRFNRMGHPRAAQDRTGWRKLVTERSFDVGKPHVRPLRCETRESPEDMRRSMAQHAIFDAAVATPTP
jgi:hypothetical protein